MKLRVAPVLCSLLVYSAISTACSKPREFQKVDPHLKAAQQLVSSDPEKALAELEKAGDSEPAKTAYLRGLALKKQGKFEDASSALKESVRLDPDSLEPRSALARVLLSLGKTDEAREHFQKVIAKHPGDLLSILYYSVCVSTEKQRQEALFALRAWPEKRPKPMGNSQALPLYAEYFLLLAELQPDKALASSARASAKKAELASVGGALALTLQAQRLGKDTLAQSLLSKLATSDAQPDQLELVATIALEAGALNTAENALKRLPGDLRSFEILVLRGRVELARRRPQRALSPLKAARKTLKKRELKRINDLDYLISLALIGTESSEDARELLEALLKRTPEHRGAQLALAQVDLNLGDLSGAISRLDALSKQHPEDGNVIEALGRAQLKARKPTAAVKTFRSLALLRPKDPAPIHRIASILRSQKKESAALKELEQGVKTFPTDVILLRSLATQYLRLKQPARAIEVVEASTAAKQDPVGVALLLADLYDGQRRPEEMRSTLNTLVQKVPRSDRAWTALAIAQKREGDLKGAEDSLRKVLELNPDATTSKVRLAALLSKRGKKAEAATVYADLVNATEKNLVALNNAAVLYVGALDDPKRAVEFAERAYKLAPNHPAVLDTLGWSLARRGSKEDLERAAALLKRAHAKQQIPETSYHYGYLLLKTGNSSEGLALLRSALSEAGEEAWREDAAALLK